MLELIRAIPMLANARVITCESKCGQNMSEDYDS
jgi:hypothetical protein